MKMDRRITGGLAWAGLVVILAVPSADILFGKPTVHADITSDMSAVRPGTATAVPAALTSTAPSGDAAAAQKPTDADPVQTASVAGTPQSSAAADPAGAASPKSDGTAPAQMASTGSNPQTPAPTADGAAAPAQVASTDAAPATAVPGESDPSQAMQVASTQADEVPPIPMPRSMRPQSVDLASAPAPQDGQPLILDENQVRRDQAALDREAVRPPVEDPRPSPADQRSVAADQRPGEFFGPPDASEDRMIGEDQLEAWNSGSLSDYLRRNGLLDDSAAPPTEPEIDDSYDPDGFYLSDGPNRSRRDDYYRRRYLDSWYF